MHVASVAGREVVIVRCRSGLYAIRNVCPHQGAPICGGLVTGTYLPSDPGVLSFGLEDEIVRCPWHGWEFEVKSGRAVFGISEKRLVRYPTTIRGGDLWVRLPGGNGKSEV
jgi:nitrite reductase/ring-hydroxylating ferredoxin subunit